MPWRPYQKFHRSKKECTLYLVHFSRPFGHAQHYMGITANGRAVEERLEEHRIGKGAKLCKYAVEAGAELVLARVWENVPRFTEIKFKNRGGMRKHCPICLGQASIWKRGETHA